MAGTYHLLLVNLRKYIGMPVYVLQTD